MIAVVLVPPEESVEGAVGDSVDVEVSETPVTTLVETEGTCAEVGS